MLWRAIFYYPFLVMGTLVLPKWIAPKFIKQGQENGHDPAVLEKIWGDWEKFASYAFNKSHATCYSWVAYQTAYLKAHYPAEYMAALMTRRFAHPPGRLAGEFLF